MVGLDDLSSLFQPELFYGTQTPQIESGAGNSTIAVCCASVGVCSRQRVLGERWEGRHDNKIPWFATSLCTAPGQLGVFEPKLSGV